MTFSAQRYLRSKKLSLDDAMAAQAHADAFVVAGVERLSILQDIRDALAHALETGQPMRSFIKDLAPELAKKGWLGDDGSQPDQEVLNHQANSPRRLRLIYDTNVRQAYHAGQWSRIEKRKKTMPYLIYRLGPSTEHRLEHVQWAGVTLPVDDPFWQIAAPQNGYNCKCRLDQVSRTALAQIKKQGGVLERSIDGRKRYPLQTKAPEFQYKKVKNKRTGQIQYLPQGIDAGFEINQGRYGAIRMRQILAQRANRWFDSDPEARDAYLARMSTNQHEQLAFEHFVMRAKAEPQSRTTVGYLSAAEQHIKPDTKLDEPIVVESKLISASTKAARHAHSENNLTPEEWITLPDIIANPDAVYLDTQNKDDAFVFVRKLGKGKMIKVVVQPNFKKGREFWHSVRTAFKVDLRDIQGDLKSGVLKKIR